MKPMIEFCNGNCHTGIENLLQKDEIASTYEIMEYGCLGNCGECAFRPFVMVNGVTVTADSLEQLHHEIATERTNQEAHQQALDALPFLDD